MIHEEAHPDATIIWGAAFDPTLVDEIKVTIIATGFIDSTGKPNDGTRNKATIQTPVVTETPKVEVKPQPVAEPVVKVEPVVIPETPVVTETPKVEVKPQPVAPAKSSLNDDLNKGSAILDFMDQYNEDYIFIKKNKN